MPFRFHLDPVLRHRKRAEDTAARVLARARHQLDATAERLEALRRAADECRLALATAADQGSSGWELADRARDVEHLERHAERCVAELAAEQAQVDAARAALTEAARNRQVLERLEASERSAYARRLAKVEQRQTDDIAAAGLLWRASQPDRHEDTRP
jgi:flagellar export protein FliJ